MSDKIKPDYYRKNGLDVIDFCHMLDLDFLQGNVVKYTVRYKEKGGIEDLRKAQEYLRRLIEYENGGEEIEVQEEDDFERIAYQRGFVRSEYAHLGDPHFEQVMTEIIKVAEYIRFMDANNNGLVLTEIADELEEIAKNQGSLFRQSPDMILAYIKERVLGLANQYECRYENGEHLTGTYRITEELRDIFGYNKPEEEETLVTQETTTERPDHEAMIGEIRAYIDSVHASHHAGNFVNGYNVAKNIHEIISRHG